MKKKKKNKTQLLRVRVAKQRHANVDALAAPLANVARQRTKARMTIYDVVGREQRLRNGAA